jgi:hypothetical protein
VLDLSRDIAKQLLETWAEAVLPLRGGFPEAVDTLPNATQEKSGKWQPAKEALSPQPHLCPWQAWLMVLHRHCLLECVYE